MITEIKADISKYPFLFLLGLHLTDKLKTKCIIWIPNYHFQSSVEHLKWVDCIDSIIFSNRQKSCFRSCGRVGRWLQQAAWSLVEKKQNLQECFQSHKPNAPFLLSRNRVNKMKRRKTSIKCICKKKTNKGKVIFSK